MATHPVLVVSGMLGLLLAIFLIWYVFHICNDCGELDLSVRYRKDIPVYRWANRGYSNSALFMCDECYRRARRRLG